MSDLRYVCLFTYSGVQQILFCVCFFVLCTRCFEFLWYSPHLFKLYIKLNYWGKGINLGYLFPSKNEWRSASSDLCIPYLNISGKKAVIS